MEHHTALVGFLECGCVVAADLDGKKESVDAYIARGYGVRWVTKSEAKKMLRESRFEDCPKHERVDQCEN